MNMILNVPDVKGPKKHKAIIEKIVSMGKDDHITLINDHDPKPLLTALDSSHPFAFRYEYLKSTPGVFKVDIYRAGDISDFNLEEIALKDITLAIDKVTKVDPVKGQQYPLHFKYWTPDLWKGFIKANHHHYEIDASNELVPIMNKVVKVHHKEIPELEDIQSVFDQLVSDIEIHCNAQERDYASKEVQDVNKELNHLIERLNALTYGFTPPQDSCPLTRTLYKRLHELCIDLTYHLFVENHLVTAG